MYKPRVHHHPRNASQEMYGSRLEGGDFHKPGDICDCTDGSWRLISAHLYGQPIDPASEVIVIRPLPVLVLGV
jgi:hypothetical protein